VVKNAAGGSLRPYVLSAMRGTELPPEGALPAAPSGAIMTGK